jgi:pimeloyl-ACP methyl ester carboxylesterase
MRHYSISEGTAIQSREYGTSEPMVLVLHGGPGAPGGMAPVARGLADSFRVLEPLQRGSGSKPLTVARHVADLHELVESRCGGARPALVGHSWGAMLALAYAAAYPGSVSSLVLIGCGTFDPAARARLRAICEGRMDDGLRRRLERLPEEFPDPDERLRVMGNLILPLYSYELVTTDQEVEACDARAHRETWEDMVRLQEEGVYPTAFSAIDVPVLMLHGAFDPHPGRMIRESLEPHLPQLEYREWERCGHYPWLEKAVRDEFFAVLREWLSQRFHEAPFHELPTKGAGL